MANIGYFTKTRSGFEGTITTLTLCSPARFIPNRNKKSEASPDYFIKAGDSDLGVAWRAETVADATTAYLRCVLDDPSFVSPIQAALFERGNGADLVWSRREKA